MRWQNLNCRSTFLLLGCLFLLLTQQSAIQGQRKKGKAGQRAGEVNTPPARGERLITNLKVGNPAVDFTLPILKDKDKRTITLSQFRGKKPVVLIFGSYT